MYRRSTGSGTSSLTLESAAFGGGRLTPSGAMLYVTDYLGSVRAVVNGSNGAIYKASDYSPYGEQSDAESMQTASTPAWITFRDAYTGQEDQHPDFGTSYTDFGARQYSPALRRWMAPDPLSEKYYGISPYAFCAGNPVKYLDPDGEIIGTAIDVISVGAGIRSFIKNVSSGNVRGAVGDGIGVIVDVAAAAIPFVPGGVGLARNGAKAAKALNAIDNAADAAKGAETVLDAGTDAAKAADSVNPIRGGDNIHTQLGKQKHKEYNPGEGYIKEYKLPSGKRADAVNFETGDVRELKPNNKRAVKQGEKQVQAPEARRQRATAY